MTVLPLNKKPLTMALWRLWSISVRAAQIVSRWIVLALEVTQGP